MKKRHVDHVLRAAGRITGERRFIIIGSQALHGRFPDLADEIGVSVEVDLIAGEHPERGELLNAIGQDSQFHATFGYYADPVDMRTAVLPADWQSRLVPLSAGDTGGVEGLCLDPHDLVISKYVAGREKDLEFNGAIARRGLVEKDRLIALLRQTSLDPARAKVVLGRIERDFAKPRGARARDGK